MKILRCLTAALLLFGAFTFSASAYEPYKNYTYSKTDNSAQEEPQAYMPSGLITGESMGTIPLSNPEDLHVSSDGNIYITDTGNNRVLVLDKSYKLIHEIAGFMNDGVQDTFQSPFGVFTTSENIYICDSVNARIVVLDKSYAFVRTYTAPNSSLISKNYVYKPVKIAVDKAKRLFVISEGDNNGIIEFAEDGSFTGYYGANATDAKIFNIFNFTEEQKKRSTKNIPVEFSNIDIDNEGFVYGVVSSYSISGKINEDIFVQRLNPMGIDVLKRNGFFSIMGDINYREINKTPELSQLTDIAVGKNGVYSVLGKRTGRIYTYDENGNLMYIFGGIGNSFGQFSLPIALDFVDESTCLVLDRNLNQILEFKPTNYGSLIMSVSEYNYSRKYEEAEKASAQLLKYTVKSDTAYNNMANALLRKGENEKAQKYYYLSKNQDGYSDALKYIRRAFLERYFVPMFLLIITAVAAVNYIKSSLRKRRKKV